MAIINDQETINAFIQESKEHLEGIEDDLLAIEEDGAEIDLDRVNKVFRAVHSIKGGAGFLGLEKVKELGHSSENVMGKIRGRELVPTPAIISVLLDAADMLSTLINRYESSNEADISIHLARLGAIISGEPVPETVSENVLMGGAVSGGNGNSDQPHTPQSLGLERVNLETTALSNALEAGNFVFIIDYDLENDIQKQGKSVEEILEAMRGIGEILGTNINLAAADLGQQISDQGNALFVVISTIMEKDLLAGFSGIDPSHIQVISPDDLGDAKISPPAEGPGTPPSIPQSEKNVGSLPPPTKQKTKDDPAPTSALKASAGRQENSLRVNVKTLDNLMTLAGELVLTRNQFMQAVSSKKIQGVDNICQRLDLVTSELQESIMSTRMQPVGNVFSKFKRIVRDLSQKLGKETNLIIKGEEVELDKTIIEAIGDPLTHLVRNSVDHGLEMSSDRVAAGKSAAGNLRLTAFHEGGQVMIAIEDDGAGINTEKVKAKALSMGLYDAVALEAMSQDELAKLIFLPGMSTAKVVSDVSGRGVGMDVVHTNIAQVGGSVDIETELGKGTLITIKLPLTLAIIPSLIVTAQGERFAIPQVNMVELVRIPAGKVKDRIEKLGGALVMRLRGELLPLIRLVDALGIQEICYEELQAGGCNLERRLQVADRRTKDLTEQSDANEGEMDSGNGDERRTLATDRRKSRLSAYNILVVSAGDYHYGLIVDQLLDSEEIVVKPLGVHLRDCKCYAGATVQGDGRVALILDIVGISTLMKLKNVAKKAQEQTSRIAEKSGRMADIQSLLIVRNSPQEQMAVPLDLVSRIERNRVDDIKITGGRKTINYRGGSLPLFSVDEVVKVSAPLQERSSFYTVVFLVNGKEVGMILSEVVDVVTDDFQIDEMTHRQPGIMGSTIIMGEITLLVDLFGVVACIMPDWAETISTRVPTSQSANIMVVEDSPFFAKQIIDFLKDVGYTCYPAADGVEALEILAREKTNIDLILTDIEMPHMNGLEMTKKIREDKMFADLPIIAVTSLYGEAAEKRGLEAGINEYLVKLDREKIIKTIRRCLHDDRK